MNPSCRSTTASTTMRRPTKRTLELTRERSHARIRGMPRALGLAAGLLAAGLLAGMPSPVAAQSAPPGCVGDTDAGPVPQKPGPDVRFGINPPAVPGQLGPLPADALPEDPAKQLARLAELRRPGAPFPLRLTRFFWRDGEAGFPAFLALTGQYTNPGLP